MTMYVCYACVNVCLHVMSFSRHSSFLNASSISMTSSMLWDITPCSSLKVNRRFGRTFRLHFQSRRISQARNQRHEVTKGINEMKVKDEDTKEMIPR
jgi:hypothetical protein